MVKPAAELVDVLGVGVGSNGPIVLFGRSEVVKGHSRTPLRSVSSLDLRPTLDLLSRIDLQAPGRQKQAAQVISRHADDGKDVPQRAFRHVPTEVHRYDDAPSVRMSHHMVASTHPDDLEPGTLKSPDNLRPGHGRDRSGH
jgi:hypothetical protein